MRCFGCGLPDPYCGNGDGIGSCDCPRCDCCLAGPEECDCRMDWDEDPDNDTSAEVDDFLCNDTGCVWRQHRADLVAERAAFLAERAAGGSQ